MSHGNATDLTGEKFGRLTAIKPTKERKNGSVMWLCECECGNKTKVTSGRLSSGDTKSCGCYRPKTYKKENLVGKRFGRLKVVKKETRRVNKAIMWSCVCDCGNRVIVAGISLRGGSTRSCGCLKKEKSSESFGKIRDKGIKRLREQEVEGTSLYAISPDKKKRNDNTSGVTGVYYVKRTKSWTASIQLSGKSIYLGYFKDKQDAINARKEAEEEYFKPILEKYKEENLNE